MRIQIERIYLSRELRKERNLEVKDDNTDVIVKTKDGATYIAPFFSYESIPKIVEENQVKGEFLNGQYYWMPNMVLIKDCTREKIESVVNNLLMENDFNRVFQLL